MCVVEIGVFCVLGGEGVVCRGGVCMCGGEGVSVVWWGRMYGCSM